MEGEVVSPRGAREQPGCSLIACLPGTEVVHRWAQSQPSAEKQPRQQYQLMGRTPLMTRTVKNSFYHIWGVFRIRRGSFLSRENNAELAWMNF